LLSSRLVIYCRADVTLRVGRNDTTIHE
jgi:hypothetical protein